MTEIPRLELLETILSQPSAPFRERHVIAEAKKALDAARVPYFIDPIGNIVVGLESKAEYQRVVRQRSAEPLRIFVAHMDHPGFHGAKWITPTRLAVRWHGGSPTADLDGASVWLADKEGPFAEGHFSEAKMIESGRAIESGVVELRSQSPRKVAAEDLYGGFSFRAPHWREEDTIYTKAADDLVGTFAVLSTAISLFEKKTAMREHFIGLLTRAEEVGYIGAIGHMELGWLEDAQRPLLCVSLETSRTLPGADIGKGPVVRLGDRAGVFNASALKTFTDLAAEVLPGKHQRRVMDGGTCEGTVGMAYGLPTVGISVPLGNYHNQNFEGAPEDSGGRGTPGSGAPAPEFVNLSDLAGLLTLCEALMRPRLNWAHPWRDKIKEFKEELRDYKPLLKSGP